MHPTQSPYEARLQKEGGIPVGADVSPRTLRDIGMPATTGAAALDWRENRGKVFDGAEEPTLQDAMEKLRHEIEHCPGGLVDPPPSWPPNPVVTSQLSRLGSIIGNTWDMVRTLEERLHPCLSPFTNGVDDDSAKAEARERTCDVAEALMANCASLEALYVHLGQIKDRVQL